MTEPPELPSGRPLVNPFRVRGWEGSPRRALSPWSHPAHEDYYVAVGKTHEAFEEFKRRMSNVAGLQRDGCLVLVMGDSGCGKTALVNRCAAWVKNTLEPHKIRGVIIDLMEDRGASSRSQSTDERIRHVCGRLIDELKHKDCCRRRP